jgi:hypothetical protein
VRAAGGDVVEHVQSRLVRERRGGQAADALLENANFFPAVGAERDAAATVDECAGRQFLDGGVRDLMVVLGERLSPIESCTA